MHAARQLNILIGVGLTICFPLIAGAAEKKSPRTNDTPDIVALTERVGKSVVVVRQYGRDGKQDGVGAGFVVAADGLIATCLHVIGEARPITIELADGRRFDATEVFASDRKLDLALVRIAASNLPALKLGDSAALPQGAPVIAFGNPAGLEHSVVQGIVSAKRDFDGVELIQLAIPIEPGNSGGPLLDTKGRVQGLLNMKSAVTANLGFAVPVNALKTLLERPNPIPISRWLTLGALNPTEWKPTMGARWSRRAGRIQVEGLGAGFGGRSLCLWQKEIPPPPYEVAVTVKLDDESGAAGLVFGSDGGDQHYGFYPTAGQMRLTRFDGPDVFSWTILKDFKTPHYQPGVWNTIRLRVETNRIVGFVNGVQVMESSDDAWRGGKVGLAKFRNTQAQFKDFRVGTNLAAAAGLAQKPADQEGSREQLLARAAALDKESMALRRAATTAHEKQISEALVMALSGEEQAIDLFRAALLVAKLDNPELDLDSYRAEFTSLGDALKQKLPPGADDAAKVAALSQFLFIDQGFHGSRTDYHNRANSYLNEVMDDREGLPITLAVLYLELARHLGLTNVTGVPVPTHFMVRFQPNGGREQIIDVFDHGKMLTRSEAVELVADNADRIDEDSFKAAKKREIITRMLHNLLGLAQRGGGSGGAGDALRYLNVILALNPDSAADRFQRARLLMQRGDSLAAKEDLRWLIEKAPAGIDLERLGELYRSL